MVRTLSEAHRNNVLMPGSGEVDVILDPEVWESHIGEEFRQRCDEYAVMKRAWDSGCRNDEVKKGIEAVSERLVALRGLILVASMDSGSKSRHLPDVGTVVSVGEKHSETFQVGDRVALRPGDMYYETDEKDCFRVLKDRYDPHTGKFLYDVTDSVPLKLTDEGPVPTGDWTIAQRLEEKYEFLTGTEVYRDAAVVEGETWLYKARRGDMLTFVFPQDGGFTKAHCLLHGRCLAAKES